MISLAVSKLIYFNIESSNSLLETKNDGSYAYLL